MDGGWSTWASWSTCSADCQHHRRRTCDNPAPQHHGRHCEGSDLNTGNCTGGLCTGTVLFTFTYQACLTFRMTKRHVVNLRVPRLRRGHRQHLHVGQCASGQKGAGSCGVSPTLGWSLGRACPCIEILWYLSVNPSTPAVPNCCCSKGLAPYWSNPSFSIFDIRALWRSVLSARVPECQKLKTVG